MAVRPHSTYAPPSTLLQDMPPDERRRKIALAISRNRGIMRRVAHELTVHRVTLYRNVNKLGLWPVVNAARVARLQEKRARKIGGGR